MLKWIGAFCIVLACTLTGFHFARRLSDRTDQLRSLLMCFQMLETEITYGSTPLETAFAKISRQDPGPIGRLFAACSHYLHHLDGVTTFECWQKAMNEVTPSLALKKSEQEWLRHVGKTIGTSDREDQRKHIRLLMTHLEKAEQEARDEQQKHEKMYKTLGVLSGLIIVILML